MIFIHPKQRFYSKVNLPNDHGCMLWFGAKDSWGYGHLNIYKKETKAHRLSYEIYFGAIPKGFYVCHTCDTPACVAPTHLFLGTPKDNSQDCLSKGRFKNSQGELNGASKLDLKSVMEVIDLLKHGYSQTEIADIHGVTNTNIGYIHNNKSWAHVPRDLKPNGNKGEINGRAKLTVEKVIGIKKLLSLGESCPSIAKKHSVSKECISKIKQNINWRHVK